MVFTATDSDSALVLLAGSAVNQDGRWSLTDFDLLRCSCRT